MAERGKLRSSILRRVIFLGIFSLMLFLAINTASAKNTAGFNVTFESTKNIISNDEQAVFDITVQNNDKTSDKFKITLNDDLWSVSSVPLYIYQTEYGLEVKQESAETFSLLLYPIGNFTPGIYTVPIEIESKNKGNIVKETLFVIVRPEGASFGQYAPTIRANLAINNNGIIDPRQQAQIYIELENLNPLNLTNLGIHIKSDLFEKDIITDLKSLEQKTETINVDFDPFQAPSTSTVTVTITKDSRTLKTIKKSIEIMSYSNLITTEVNSSGFLRSTKRKIYTNLGNVKSVENVKVPINTLNGLFTKTEPRYIFAEEKSKNDQYMTWTIELEPKEKKEIRIDSNYQIPFFIIVILIIVLVLYFVYRSPVIIRKDGEIMKSEQGGITEVKVLIYIKNRTKHTISKLKVMDKIPNIADVKDEFIIGTLKPTKIVKHDKKGTLMEWEIPSLDPFEERIISYKIKSKLSILGFFNLPPAIVQFRDEKYRERVSVSNKLRALT